MDFDSRDSENGDVKCGEMSEVKDIMMTFSVTTKAASAIK